MSSREQKKLVQEGDYLAQVDVELICSQPAQRCTRSGDGLISRRAAEPAELCTGTRGICFGFERR